MARKTIDPHLAKLLDARETARAEFERWYTRFRRAVTRMEKARQRVGRLSKRIEQHQSGQKPTTAEAAK